MKSDNKFVVVVFAFFGIVALLAMFVGFYLMLQNIKQNQTMTLVWMGVFLGGLLILVILGLIIFINKKKINK